MKNNFIFFCIINFFLSCSNSSESLTYKSKDLEKYNLFGHVQEVEIQHKDELKIIFFNERGQKIKSINNNEKIVDSTIYYRLNKRMPLI